MSTRWLVGDVFDRMAEIPDGSVDLLMTSPPFLNLRNYLEADHPDKGKEIGAEGSPAEFLRSLLRLAVEARRVLAPHGSLCVELGDTFSGSGGAGGDYTEGGLREGQQAFSGSAAKRARLGDGDNDRPPRDRGGDAWPLDKSLCLIPSLYPASLAYGRNLLDPSQTFEPWRVRNTISWLRPNPPVGALGDKWRPASSLITVACTGRQRYFDLDAVREPMKDYGPRFTEHKVRETPGRAPQIANPLGGNGERIQSNPGGAPPLDWHSDLDPGDGVGALILATHPYPGSHYATFPQRLPQKMIECMCPLRVCRVCGQPSERITEVEPVGVSSRGQSENDRRSANGRSRKDGSAGWATTTTTTLGWSDCGHDDWRPGLVLDPFAGSGTTLAVASGMGRDSIGIDLDPRNTDLAMDRVGWMFLEIEP